MKEGSITRSLINEGVCTFMKGGSLKTLTWLRFVNEPDAVRNVCWVCVCWARVGVRARVSARSPERASEARSLLVHVACM